MTLWEALVCRVKKNSQDIQKLQDDLKHYSNSGSATTPPANWTDTFVDGGRFTNTSLTLTRTDGKSVVIPHSLIQASPVISGDSADVKTVVLNSLLPADIAADLLLENPKLGDRHSAAIQKAYDDLAPKNMVVKLFGNVKATKLKGYRSDVYGQDNQAVPNRPDLTRHGGQPTLLVHGENVTLDLTGCVYEVQDMYLDGIHLTQSNHIYGGYIRTKRIHEVDPTFKVMELWRGGITGSKGKGNDWIPMIDADTGFAAKGTQTAGFNNTVSSNSDQYSTNYELAGHRSNSIDTSKLSSGGYPSGSGKAFPQQDGSTAGTWGTWFGGWHGNQSAAIVIFTFPNTPEHIQKNTTVTVKKSVIRGWIGNGIVVGLQGTLDGTYLGNSDFSQSDPLVPYNTLIEDVVIMDNYNGGIHKNRYVHLTERRNFIFRVGHPDFTLFHKNRGATGGNSIDPGYGSSSGRSLPQYGLLIEGCVIEDCARKGIDAHTGTDTTIRDNTLKGGLAGISIAIEEIHSNPRESGSSSGVQVCKYLVDNNRISAGIYGLHVINGALSERSTNRWQLRTNFIASNNIIRAPRPYFNNYGRGGFTIKDTVLVFDLPFGNISGTTSFSAIYLGSENPVQRGIPVNATLENIEIMNSSQGNFAEGFVYRGINKLKVTNMTVHTEPYKESDNPISPWAGVQGMVRSGTATIPVKVLEKPLVLIASGNTAFNASRQVHTVLDGEMGVTGTGGVVDNGGGSNPLVPEPKPNPTGGAVTSGVVRFNTGTSDVNWAASNDGKIVIGKGGTLEPAGFTLIKSVDVNTNAVPNPAPGGNNNPTPSPSPNPAPTPSGGAVTSGIVKFNSGNVTANSVTSNDGKVVIQTAGNNPPAGFTLTKDENVAVDNNAVSPPVTTQPQPVPDTSGAPVSSGIVKFANATIGANSITTADNRVRVVTAGTHAPANYTLTKESEI